MQDKPLVSVLMTAYNREKYIVEAMKAGVITLVTNCERATNELIIEGETGYYFAAGDVAGYISKIEALDSDRNLLLRMAELGMKKANELFESLVNTSNIEEVFFRSFMIGRQKK